MYQIEVEPARSGLLPFHGKGSAMAASPGDMVVYDSVMSSNLTRPEKSMLRRWFEQMTGSEMPTPGARRRASAGEYAVGSLQAVRQYGEAVLTGGALAAMHVHGKNGLDLQFLGVKVPIDFALATICGLGAVASAGHECSRDALNVGSDAAAVFTFRTMTDLLAERKLATGAALPRHLTPGSRIAGEDDDDPIARAARAL